MKRVLVSAVALAVAVGVANAADIRAPAPAVKAPAFVPPPIFTWTGFYIGGNIGYGWSDGSGTKTNTGFFGPAGPGGIPLGVSGPVSGSGDGINGGFQIGYNWQTGPLVLGIETDFQLSDGQGDISGNVGPWSITERAKNEWFGTIRGRVGYAMDRWLLYFTGGGVYSHNTISGTATRPGFAARPFSASATGWSWTVGGGVEAALWDRWSAKLEYLYLAGPDQVPTQAGTTVSGDLDSHVIRVGLNYRF